MRQTLRRMYPTAVMALLFVVVAGADIARAADWPQFLGPARNGISKETGLVQSWGDGGPKELWRIPGGVGMTSVVVQGKLACTMVQTGGEQRLLAFDAATGKETWSAAIAPTYRNGMGNGPRGTPALSKDAAFVFTGEGVLARVSLKDGNVDWKVDTLKELPGSAAEYGMACSPILWGEAVVVQVGARQATVAAFSQKTGKVLWTDGRGETPGYSSPAILKVGGKEQLVVFAGASAFGVDSKGKRLWQFPYETGYDCNIATPIAIDGNVFLSAGENHGSTLLDLKPGGTGLKPSVVWDSTGVRSVLRTEWQTALLLDGHLYGYDNVGGAGPITNLTCVNAKTGERVWQEARFGKGNAIAADGILFATTMKGELILMKPSPKGYEELGRKTVIETTRQAPSLANGRLYVRDDKEIVCFDVKQ